MHKNGNSARREGRFHLARIASWHSLRFSKDCYFFFCVSPARRKSPCVLTMIVILQVLTMGNCLLLVFIDFFSLQRSWLKYNSTLCGNHCDCIYRFRTIRLHLRSDESQTTPATRMDWNMNLPTFFSPRRSISYQLHDKWAESMSRKGPIIFHDVPGLCRFLPIECRPQTA